MSSFTHPDMEFAELRGLLDRTTDDLMKIQLESRLKDLQTKSNFPVVTFYDSAPPHRTAIFLSSGGVQGMQSVRAALAGEVLIQYEKMFVAQAMSDERTMDGRTRRRRGAPKPALLLTGTPRGSFGFQLEPQRVDDVEVAEIHAVTLKKIAHTIVAVSALESDSIVDAIEDIPDKVIPPLKKLMNTLAQFGSEVKLAFDDAPSEIVTGEQIQAASARLDSEIVDESIKLDGVFRGLTRETLVFDFISDEDGIITGSVSDSLLEKDLTRLHNLTDMRCTASMIRTSVLKVGQRSGRARYTLFDLAPLIDR